MPLGASIRIARKRYWYRFNLNMADTDHREQQSVILEVEGMPRTLKRGRNPELRVIFE